MNRFTHGLAAAACLAIVAAVPMALSGTARAAPAASAVTTAQVANARAAAPVYVAPARMLRYGMKGSDVKALQQRLAALKYSPGPIDGIFGSGTREAVWAFQEVQRLTVDGVVGPITGRALVNPRAYPARYPNGGALRVEVNLTTRVLVVYQNSRVALISHISAGGGYYYDGGARAITPTGHFRTTHYMPGWITVPLGVMYNPVFFIGTAYAIHGEWNYNVPLNPVSHGCVRIPYNIAVFFHNMVKTPGTSVYIYK
ncbi:MAG TPA: L,D-transpeptidase family protein [Trebonia sp.]|jgi:peptidoglycan hydrolase-like protein with peptidoglycan-binding domain